VSASLRKLAAIVDFEICKGIKRVANQFTEAFHFERFGLKSEK
jgi:hypothetical protein